MPRHVFYSFEYKLDNWRVSKIRNIGAIDGNRAAHDNDWESVASAGDAAIKRWIDNQMDGRSTTIVLIGATTAGRRWINYEIAKSWDDYKGLVGIHIHNLEDRLGRATSKGDNPFQHVTLQGGGTVAGRVPVYDPPYTQSRDVYNYIADNIERWIDHAHNVKRRKVA